MKNIVFVMKVMMGGGAERVISMLSSSAVEKGHNVTLIITHQSLAEAVLRDIDSRIKVISLVDETVNLKKNTSASKIIRLYSRFTGKLSRIFTGKTSDKSLVLKYLANNYAGIKWLRSFFKNNRKACVVAFLYDSIFYSFLSVTKNNRLIISERGDPQQSIKSKTTMAFIKGEFNKADNFVFQSPDVQKWYEQNTPVRGTVIFNPIKADLPEPYTDERKKKIVNFCRISSQKNLVLLLDAYELFYKHYPEYELYIYGDPVGNDCDSYLDNVKAHLAKLDCKNNVHILPSLKNIHSEIRDYAMFVSSSDFEGMSNSMLEAMALGLPCVCTDCPAGGARAVIKNGENGLLVPVNDAQQLSDAMIRVVSEQGLGEKLAFNASQIRETQSLEKIIENWMEIING